MLKAIASLSALFAVAALAGATVITGHFTWVVGTLTTNVTAGTAPQTIGVKVGTTVHTLSNTYITGIPGTLYPSGSNFEVLQSGSLPFAANYTVLQVPISNGGWTAARNVPMSATGVLSANVGLPITAYANSMVFYLPYFTLGTMSFRNGMQMTLGSDLASYSLTIPTASTPTFGTVVFPSNTTPVESFGMIATGNGTLNFFGTGNSNTLWVTGTLAGTSTIFTSASLSIGIGVAY